MPSLKDYIRFYKSESARRKITKEHFGNVGVFVEKKQLLKAQNSKADIQKAVGVLTMKIESAI